MNDTDRLGKNYTLIYEWEFAEDTTESDGETQMKVIGWYIYVALASVNCLCHGVGSALLALTYKRRKTSQHLLLLNLSVIELVRNMTRMALCTLFIIKGGDSLGTYFIWTVYITSITYLYFSAMFLITIDRLVATVLNLRQRIICTPTRTKCVIAGVWSLVLIITITVFAHFNSLYGILWMFVRDSLHHIIVYKVIAVLTVLYLILAINCYIIIFLSYTKSKRSISASKVSNFQFFKMTKFYISILLITSFLLLQVIPYGVLIINTTLSLAVKMVLNILSELSDTVDFAIYVFMYNPVFQLLKNYTNLLYIVIEKGRSEKRFNRNVSVRKDSPVLISLDVYKQKKASELVSLKDELL